MKDIKERIWEISKPAKEFPEDWYVIPALSVIEIIESSPKETKDNGGSD
jgi:hypothetical protein